MKVLLGIHRAPGPLTLEVDEPADTLLQRLKDAMSSGTVVELVDTKGETSLVAGSAIAYVQVGNEQVHKVGFGRP